VADSVTGGQVGLMAKTTNARKIYKDRAVALVFIEFQDQD
jgi:hypothetical protein